MNITTISARVMRSFDYSHFEITLGATLERGDDHSSCADDLRKSAARLADKAVQQYKVAKANEFRLRTEARSHEWDKSNAERIRKIAETDRSPQDQAELKAFDDKVWQASRRFDYEDDWQDDGFDDES